MKRKLLVIATVAVIAVSAKSFAADDFGYREECRIHAKELRAELDKKGLFGDVIGCMIAGRTSDSVKFGLAVRDENKSIYSNSTYTTVTIKTGK